MPVQLTAFVLQEFFRSEDGGKKEIPFETIQTLAASILQTVFEPFMHLAALPEKQDDTGDL